MIAVLDTCTFFGKLFKASTLLSPLSQNDFCACRNNLKSYWMYNSILGFEYSLKYKDEVCSTCNKFILVHEDECKSNILNKVLYILRK